MKYVWEEVDVRPGRRVWAGHRPTNGQSLIGYEYVDTSQRLVLVSMDDGLITHRAATTEEMALHLNAHGYKPEDIRLPDIQPESR